MAKKQEISAFLGLNSAYFFVRVHSYINCGNIAWRSTYKSKLKKKFTYQKKAARVIFFADCLAHVKPLILDMNALNVHQINIHQNLILLYKAHRGMALSIFLNKFSKIIQSQLSDKFQK